MAMLAFTMAVSAVYAQNAQDIPEALRDKALSVSVQTQVPGTVSAPAWEANEVKYTLPGSAVSVKLVGESLVVLVQATPYQGPEGLVLVAQAQVWIREQGSIRYLTVLNTFRIGFGEPVVFYPLGQGGGKAPLRMIIVVNPYLAPLPKAEPPSRPPKAEPATNPPKAESTSKPPKAP